MFQTALEESERAARWRVDGVLVKKPDGRFATRHFDHWMEIWRGAYTIHDPTKFGSGERSPVYVGYAYKTPRWERGKAFIAAFRELNPQLQRMLELFEIWLAPTRVDRRLQRRIESAIISRLYSGDSPQSVG